MSTNPANCSPLDAPTVLPSQVVADNKVDRERSDGKCVEDHRQAAVGCLPKLEGYEILRELGRGGMGVVYLARQLSIGRLVALKTIQSSDDEELNKLLAAEAAIVGKLDHPVIVPVHEARQQGNAWFFSMGFVQGDDLARILARGVLTPEQVARLGVRLCEGLEHAHAQGIIHLDIKPANILVDHRGAPKLTDFGLAAVQRNGQDGRSIIGTPQFMSPEQALNACDEIGPASDIYSLGAVLYAALAGRPPIVSAQTDDLIMKVISQSPTPLRELEVKVPRPLNNIICQCLSKRPNQRYASVVALREDLEAFLEDKPVQARVSGIIDHLDSYIRHHVLAATISGTSGLLVLTLLALMLIRSWTQSSSMNDLRVENEQLEHLVALQNELIQGRSKTNHVARELADAGDDDRASLFAAMALAGAITPFDKQSHEDLVELVVGYAQRHPTENAGQTTNDLNSDDITKIEDAELLQIVQRIIEDFEHDQESYLRERRASKSTTTTNYAPN